MGSTGSTEKDNSTDYYNLNLTIDTAQKMVSKKSEMKYLDDFQMNEETNYFEKFQKQDCNLIIHIKITKN